MGLDRDLDPEDRGGDRGVEQVLVALVVGVRDQGDAGHQQLRPGGGDDDGVAAVGAVERDVVVGAGALLVLQLGLGDRGLEGGVPEARRLRGVRLAALQVAQERPLADPLAGQRDRGVRGGPVDRQAQLAVQALEGLLVDGGELLAQLDEVAAADGVEVLALLGRLLGRGVAVDVGDRGVAADAVEVLDPAFRGQPVVVPPHRVEDLLAGHALVPGDEVGVRVAEDVPDVQGPADGGRRRVDGEDVAPLLRPVEGVGALLVPHRAPLVLETFEGRLLRDVRAWHRRSKVPVPDSPLRTRCHRRERIRGLRGGRWCGMIVG